LNPFFSTTTENTTAINDLPFNYKAFTLLDWDYSSAELNKAYDGVNYGFENQPDSSLGT
jgi:hypothetical protein